LRRRVGLLVGAGVVLVVVSLVWLVAVDLTPAGQRPYVGASLDNSELSLTFGHNGFGRVLGERGAPVQTVTVVPAAGSLRSAGALSSTGHPGLLRLFGLSVGDQGAWMLPFALFGLVAMAIQARRGGRRNPRLGVLLVLGGWFVVEAVVLSVSTGIVHPYYVSALGPGVAALVGGGAAAFVELAPRSRAYLVLPAGALIATVAVAIMLLHREYDYLHWLWPILIGIVGAGVVMMLWQPRAAAAAIAAGLGALLVVPAIYSATVWQVPVNGTFPVAGPYIQDDTESLGIPLDVVPVYQGLLRYVKAHQTPRRWDLLTQGSTTAAPLTLLGGRVAALGGYGTTDPVLEPRGLAALVSRGEVRFVALGGGYASRGGNAASTAVAHACRKVAPSRWRKPQNVGTAGHPIYTYPRGGWNLALYDCAGRTSEIAAHQS
jgi:4-amino-4-deoxy-L-arabinose transferase-like glycosyltransferase